MDRNYPILYHQTKKEKLNNNTKEEKAFVETFPWSELQAHSSSLTFKLLSMTSYGGELLLDLFSPWSGISNHLSSFFIPLPLIFKKQRTPLMKKMQGLQAPYGATSCGIKTSSSRWCSFASSIFLFGQFTLIPCSSSYSPCISSIFLWFGGYEMQSMIIFSLVSLFIIFKILFFSYAHFI